MPALLPTLSPTPVPIPTPTPTLTPTPTAVAETGAADFVDVGSGDGGPATSAQLFRPEGVALDGAGNLYIADTGTNRIRKVDTSGTITTVAGTSAQLSLPSSVALDGAGNLYIADSGNDRILKVDTNGTITTVAGGVFNLFNFLLGLGDGGPATSEDLNFLVGLGDGGPATSAFLNSPEGVAVDGAGNLYIADTSNYRIRKVGTDGIITTVAGTGSFGFSGDGGPATSAEFDSPEDVVVDGAGNLYIADAGKNYRIRKVDTGGIITTVAGTWGAGFSGDDGPATSALLNFPYGIALDGAGNLYIADTVNHRIRKVDTGGTITTVAGTGAAGFSGDDGPATSAQLNFPYGVALDGAGNLYIADTVNNRIRKVDTNGAITTVAGGGTPGGPTTPTPAPAPTPTPTPLPGGRGADEAQRAEFHDISTAVTALMVENGLATIPNVVSANTSPCTVGTQDMGAYPDTASVAGSADKTTDPSSVAYTSTDGDGYLLLGHDIFGGDGPTALVNYLNFKDATYCYTIDANGTVHQYLEDGTEQVY